MKEGSESENEVKKMLDQSRKMDRREFFSTTGKLVIPTIAIVGLSLSGFTERALAAGCDDCNHNCKNSCLGGCIGGCQGDCSRGCQGSCTGCTGTAK